MPWSFVLTQADLGLDTMPLTMPTPEQRYYAIVRKDNREDASLKPVAPRLLACSLNIRCIPSHQLVAVRFTSQFLQLEISLKQVGILHPQITDTPL